MQTSAKHKTRGVKPLILFSFFADFMFFYPFYDSMFMHYGISRVNVATILAFQQIGRIIFDLPMGLIADTLGRKNPILMSQVLKIIALLLWYSMPNIYTFSIGMFILGASTSCLFGNTEAYVYSLAEQSESQAQNQNMQKNQSSTSEKAETIFAKHIGAIYATQNGAIALVSFLGYKIFNHIGYNGILTLSITASFIALFFATKLEQHKPGDGSNNNGNKGKSLTSFAILIKKLGTKTIMAVQEIGANKTALNIWIWFLVHSALYILMIDLFSVGMIDNGFSPEMVALSTSLMTVTKVITNLWVFKISKFFKHKFAIGTDLVSLILLLALSLQYNKAFLLIIALFMLMFTFSDIAIISLLQKEIKDEVRTVIMSGSGILVSILAIFLQQIAIGHLFGRLSAGNSSAVAFGLSATVALICLIRLNGTKSSQRT